MMSTSRARYAFIALLFSFGAQGLEKPERLRVANHDLRSEKAIFRVKSHNKKVAGLALLEAGQDQFMIDLHGEGRMKVSNEMAQKADGYFVSEFIQLKYGESPRLKRPCESEYTLTLRGETEIVCRKEKERIGKVVAIIKDLKRDLKIKK